MEDTKTILLEIITPERVLFREPVRSVVCVAERGSLGILPGHADLVARLRPGDVNITDAAGKSSTIAVSGGFLEVHPDRAVVFTESATPVQP